MLLRPRLTALLCLAGLLAGCARERERIQAILPSPLAAAQRVAAKPPEKKKLHADDFRLREREFVNRTPRLNVAGEDHVRQIAAALPTTRFQVMIEPASPDEYPDAPQIDQQRRSAVVQGLLSLGITDAESRVSVGPAAADGSVAKQADHRGSKLDPGIDMTCGTAVATDEPERP
jgi:hypothetical protein